MLKKCVLIYNPESGKRDKTKFLKMFRETFEQENYEVSIQGTEKKKDATNIIQNLEQVDLVIVAGGDGTLNEAVTGNMRREKPLLLSYLPLGTTNDVGTMYGFTKDMYSNIKRILNGTIQNIDVCTINQQPFVYVACLGNYVNVSYDTPRRLKKKYGKVAYVLYGLKQLKDEIRSYHLTYTVGGKTYEGEYSFLFITNTSHLAGLGIDNIYKDVKLNDNMFEVALFHVKTKKDIMHMLYCLRTMDVEHIPGVTYHRTNKIEITFEDVPSSSWCIDGEELKNDTNSFCLEVHQGFQMLLPKENVDKLFQEPKK